MGQNNTQNLGDPKDSSVRDGAWKPNVSLLPQFVTLVPIRLRTIFFFWGYFLKDPPKRAFKTSIEITSRGYFYFSRLFFCLVRLFLKNSLKWFLGWWKNDKETSHKGIWWSECPRSAPGIKSEILIQGAECPRDRRDMWRDRWDMSLGQTGHTPGGVPPKFFMLIVSFLSPFSLVKTLGASRWSLVGKL